MPRASCAADVYLFLEIDVCYCGRLFVEIGGECLLGCFVGDVDLGDWDENGD